MAPLDEEFDAYVKAKGGAPLPGNPRDQAPPPGAKDYVIKGDFAKTQAPSLGVRPKTLDDEFEEYQQEKTLGYSKPRGMVVSDPKEVQVVQNAPKDLSDEFDHYVQNKGQWASLQTFEPKAGSGILKDVVGLLSWDEHLLIKGVYKTFKLPEKNDWTDYTYTTLFKEMGAPNTFMTEAMGAAAGIFLSPSFYLTGGASAAYKVGAKLFLTREGKRLASAVIKDRAEKELAELAVKSGKEVVKEAKDRIWERTTKQVDLELQQKFGEIAEANKQISVGKDVAALPGRIKDTSVVALEVPSLPGMVKGVTGGRDLPFAGAKIPLVSKEAGKTKVLGGLASYEAATVKVMGVPIIPGERIAQVMKEYGVLDLLAKTQQLKGVKETIEVGQALADPIVDAAKGTKELLGRLFIPNYQMRKEARAILEAHEQFERDAMKWKNWTYAKVEKGFSGLSKEERLEFGELAKQASFHPETIRVSELSNNPKVKDALDRWYGQGTYEGKGSWADKFAHWSGVFGEKKRANWFPGIQEIFAEAGPQFKRSEIVGPFAGGFQKARVLTEETNKYTRDPVKAIAYRATELAWAKLSDDFYKKVTSSGIGGAKQFKSWEQIPEGYVKLDKPFLVAVKEAGDPDIAKLMKPSQEAQWYVRKEFADGYNAMIKNQQFRIPIWSYWTDVWKAHVTAVNPAYHTGNYLGNLVLNSMKIGFDAFDFIKNKDAAMMAIGKDMKKEAGQLFFDKVFHYGRQLLVGKRLEKEIVTETGERLQLKHLISEAEEAGVIKTGSYHADITGHALQGEAKVAANQLMSFLKVASPNWTVSKWGRAFGDAVESQARLVNYMTWRMRGLSPKLAAAEVNEALYNYGAITGGEQVIRQFIPFYTFDRKNYENYARMLVKRPGAVAAQLKFFRDLGPTESEAEDIPQHYLTRGIMNFKGTFITGFKMPWEGIVAMMDDPSRETILKTNPFFMRMPIEKIAGKDFFSNRDLPGLNHAQEFAFVVRATERDDLPSWVKAPFMVVRSFLKLQRDESNPDKVIGDADRMHLLRATFTSRWQSMIATVDKEDMPGLEAAARLALGFAKIEPDPEFAIKIARRGANQKLKRIVQKYNGAKAVEDVTAFYGGSEESNALAQEYLKRIKDNESVMDLNDMLKEADEDFRQLQDEQVNPWQ
jgi:hypothetical protein